ncbi:MAG: YigZ family protein [Bacillota bacterium]|nr:MAG: YigZ family protein [Bacillota bacterium]
MNDYLSVEGEISCEYVVERSRFITHIAPVENEESAKAYVEKIRKAHSLATHNCYAYIADECGLKQKFSDDGEPQGTAGLPMLEVLKARGLKKCAVVVTRYFGGVKLGAGGLVRAYTKAVADGVNAAKVVKYTVCAFIETAADYEYYAKILKFAESKNYKIIDTQFSERATVRFAIPAENLAAFEANFADCFNGRLETETSGTGYYAFEE